MIHSLQPLLQMISNLEEGSEKLEVELRKWLFQGQMSEARDLRPSSDKAYHPRARQRCCRLGGSWAHWQHQPRDVHWGQRYLVMPSSQVSTRSQPAWEMLYERVTLKETLDLLAATRAYLEKHWDTYREVWWRVQSGPFCRMSQNRLCAPEVLTGTY